MGESELNDWGGTGANVGDWISERRPMDYREARSLVDLWNDPFIFG